MKKLLALTGCCLIPFAALIFGREPSFAKNGTEWKNLSMDQRIMYAEGFLAGYLHGTVDGASAMGVLWTGPKPPHPTTSEKQDFADQAAKAKSHSLLAGSKTYAELTDTMSTFYGDYKNVPVCWDEAILFSSASLSGQASSEEELDAARRAGAKSGCK